MSKKNIFNSFIIASFTFSSILISQTHEATSAPTTIKLRKSPGAPPNLNVSLEFQEPSKNNFLDAEETATVILKITNSGKGKASNINVQIDPPSVDYLIYEKFKLIGDIQPNSEKEVKWAISALFEVESKKAELKFIFSERNGFAPEPVKLSFPTKAFVPPVLKLADGVNIDDANQNGMIEPGEVVKVTARLVNSGSGPAKNVNVKLRFGENVFFVSDSPKEFNLGDINAGGYRDFNFTLYTNMQANDVPVYVDIFEHYNKFGKLNLKLPLAFKKIIPKNQNLIIEGKRETEMNVKKEISSLSVDVDYDIPAMKEKNENKIAVIIGVESYRNVVSVPYAKKDANIFLEYVKNLFGVIDDKNHIYFKLDDEVTKGELEKVFSEGGWLSKRVNNQSEIIVYYAGHGVPDLKTDNPYIVPYDGDPNYPSITGYSLERLYSELAKLQVKKVTIFIDACFSGGTRNNQMLLADARPININFKNPESISENMNVFAASSGNEISSSYPEKSHGLFTYFLLKGMRGDADKNNDGIITIGEMENYLIQNISTTARKLDREQNPKVYSNLKENVLIDYK